MADIIEIRELSFHFPNNPKLKIIDGISFDVKKGDFISIIGPSGCGKSTLLRNIAGLVRPSSGKVLYESKEIKRPISEISFVFQDFALLPWLTNAENVKIGLSSFEMSDAEKRSRAFSLLEKFGLTGFEDYYPNAMSGGMKQRIGIARAIISHPRVLLMDEPFSSLDELTANVLREDISEMLHTSDVSVDAVIMVTHNVEEAVELSNKIVVLSNQPSRVKAVKQVKLKYPRNRHDSEFIGLMDDIYKELTS